MPVLINFKICDNAEECGGIETCPTGALFWDEKENTIGIDNEKCISCGMCELSCPVSAIKVAKTEEEYNKIKEEIEKDPRKLTDLFLDRYGAMPIVPAFQLAQKDFEKEVLKPDKLVAVEVYEEEGINCLLKSIPINELLNGYEILFKKMEITDKDFLDLNKIKELPALLFFNKGKLIGKVTGYFETTAKENLKSQVTEILKQVD